MQNKTDVWAIAFVDGKDGLASAELRTKWVDLIARSTNLNVAQQTPQWAAYRPRSPSDLRLCVMRNAAQEIVGVTPLSTEPYTLPFSLKGRCLFEASLDTIHLMGDVPLMPARATAWSAFFAALSQEATVNALFLRVPKETAFWAWLSEFESKASVEWFFYRPQPVYRYHCIQLPLSLSAYLKQFSAKERHNIKREITQLRKAGGGQLDLTRVTQPMDVPDFLANASRVAATSWQQTLLNRPLTEPTERLQFLIATAESATLRAYCLHCGGAPCSYLIGVQSNGIFQSLETAYDEKWKTKCSPGKVLHYLVLEDLFAHEPPQMVYFGYADAWYKRFFGNCGGEHVALLVLRKNISNRLKVGAHRFFGSFVARTRPLRTLLRLTR